MLKISTDRFSQGLPDPQEAPVVCECDGCGGEIYEHSLVWVLDDDAILHPDTDCLKDYIDPMTMTIEEAMASD